MYVVVVAMHITIIEERKALCIICQTDWYNEPPAATWQHLNGVGMVEYLSPDLMDISLKQKSRTAIVEHAPMCWLYFSTRSNVLVIF